MVDRNSLPPQCNLPSRLIRSGLQNTRRARSLKTESDSVLPEARQIERSFRTIIFEARSLACKPQPFVYSRAQVVLVRRDERCSHIRIRSTEQRIGVPSRKEEIRWCRNSRVREHETQNPEYFGLYLGVGECFNAFGIIALMSTELGR